MLQSGWVHNYILCLKVDDKWIITGVSTGIFVCLALSVSCGERLLLFNYVCKKKYFHLFYAYHLCNNLSYCMFSVVFLNH